MIDFPISPSLNQVFPTTGIKQWKWNGVAWDSLSVADAQVALAVDSAAAAAASKAAIDDRIYPGTYASAPTTKPSGSAIADGDRYTGTDGYTYARIAGAWVNQTAAAAASAAAALISEGIATAAVDSQAIAPVAVANGISDDTAAFVAAYATGRRVVPQKSKKYRADLFNIDGVTLSPTATTNSLWTTELLPIEPYCTYRARYLPRKLAAAASDTTPDTLILGNSWPAGTGTGAVGYTLAAIWQFRMQQNFSRGSYANWAVPLRAIGGTTAATMAMMTANSNAFTVGANVDTASCAIVVCTRNDRNLLNVAAPLTGITLYAQLLDITHGALVARKIDPIVVIEGPTVDLTTGSILDDEIFRRYRETAVAIAGKHGASVVDYHSRVCDLKRLFGIDLRSFMAAGDTIHGNNFGHMLAWDMPVQMVLNMTPIASSRAMESNGSDYVAALYDFSPVAMTAGVTLADTGLAVNTCRKLMLSEAGNQMAYSLAPGQSLTFAPNFPVTGVLVETAMGSNGTFDVLSSNVTMQAGNSAVNAGPGGFVTPVRFFAGLGAGLHSRNSIVIKNNHATETCKITGIAYLCHAVLSTVDIPPWVQVGTWTNTTLPVGTWSGTGADATSSATVGDTSTIEFTGSIFSLRYPIGPAFGQFTYSVDGAAPVTVDCYNASTVLAPKDLLIPVTDGAHKVLITVATKNASASANTVALGAVRVGTQNPMLENLVYLPAGSSTPLAKYSRLRKAGAVSITYDGTTVVADAVTSAYTSSL